MDKPISMSVKEYLTKVMSVRTNTPASIIEAVITHQFEEAHKAMMSKNSIEISGFGKFTFKEKKAISKMEKFLFKKEMFKKQLEDPLLSEAKRHTINTKLEIVLKDIEVLKTKLYGVQQDS